jgi:polyhydroxybutyrate depolymerase
MIRHSRIRRAARSAALVGLSVVAVVAVVTGDAGSVSAASHPGRAGRSGASVGCGQRRGSLPATDSARTIMVAGESHQYLLSLPARYEPNRPSPLVVEFQGYGGTPSQMADLTQLPEKGAKRGYVVVTPEGPGHTWQLSGRGDDANYIGRLLASVESSYCVNLHRVYAAGFSQGAAFAILYACAHPDQVAAIATVAVDFRLGCATPTSILAFHGTDDPAVPYQNGDIGISLPGVKVRGTLLNMGDWARLDRCGPTVRTTKIGRDVTHTVWPKCGDGTEVGLYSVIGGGHTWPGASRRASFMYTTQTVSATDLALSFFSRHHRG